MSWYAGKSVYFSTVDMRNDRVMAAWRPNCIAAVGHVHAGSSHSMFRKMIDGNFTSWDPLVLYGMSIVIQSF
jgi:hypothetical protein